MIPHFQDWLADRPLTTDEVNNYLRLILKGDLFICTRICVDGDILIELRNPDDYLVDLSSVVDIDVHFKTSRIDIGSNGIKVQFLLIYRT